MKQLTQYIHVLVLVSLLGPSLAVAACPTVLGYRVSERVPADFDGRLEPGETAGLELVIGNTDPLAEAVGFALTLLSTDERTAVIPNEFEVPPINPGGSITLSGAELLVQTSESCAPLRFRADWSTGGEFCSQEFTIPLGIDTSTTLSLEPLPRTLYTDDFADPFVWESSMEFRQDALLCIGASTAAPEAFTSALVFATSGECGYDVSVPEVSQAFLLDPVSLPTEATAIRLRVLEFPSLAPGLDVRRVDVAADSMESVTVFTSTDGADTDNVIDADLTAFAGREVLISFHVETAGVEVSETLQRGWFLGRMAISYALPEDAVCEAGNNPPSFTATDPPAVLEGTGEVALFEWATFDPGSPSESDQVVETYRVVEVGNPALFAVEPTIDSEGTLRYTPAPSAWGVSTLTVEVVDSGASPGNTSEPKDFSIEILPVNQPPALVISSPPPVLEDAGPITIPGWLIVEPMPFEESEETTATITSIGNQLAFAPGGLPVIRPDGSLSYQFAADTHTQMLVEVTAQDNGGTVNGGDDTTTATFVLAANAVNDKPSFTASNPAPVPAGLGPVVLAGWADFYPGAPNEANQTAEYFVTGLTRPELFRALPTVSSTGVLAFEPFPTAVGTSEFTVTVKDNSLVVEGFNTSDPQTFTLTILESTVPSGPIAYHPLAEVDFLQEWSDRELLSEADNWSAVPSLVAYLGTDAGSAIDPPDPRRAMSLSPEERPAVDVNGSFELFGTVPPRAVVAEAETATSSVLALHGGRGADTPSLLLALNTDGARAVEVEFDTQDMDSSAADRNLLAVQYRVGELGDFTNLPATATSIPAIEGARGGQRLHVMLPAETQDHEQIQVRLILQNSFLEDSSWVAVVAVRARSRAPEPPVLKMEIEPNPPSQFTATGDVGGFPIQPQSPGSTTGTIVGTITGSVDRQNSTMSIPPGGSTPTLLNLGGCFEPSIGGGAGCSDAQLAMLINAGLLGRLVGSARDVAFDLTGQNIPVVSDSRKRSTKASSAGTQTLQITSGSFDYRVGGFLFNTSGTTSIAGNSTENQDGSQTQLIEDPATATFSLRLPIDNDISFPVEGLTATINMTGNVLAKAVLPLVDLNGPNREGNDSSVAYLMGGVNLLAPDATAARAGDVELTSARLRLDAPQAGESLTVDVGSSALVVSPYDNATGELRITGLAPAATYEAVLRTARYVVSTLPLPAGVRQVRVQVSDSVQDSEARFALVSFVDANKQPSFVATNPAPVPFRSNAVTITDWADFSAGGALEGWQSAKTWIVSDVTNPRLFAVPPMILPDGTLSYTPAAGLSGSSDFTLRVQDDGGIDFGGVDTSTPQVFTITVLPDPGLDLWILR